MGGGPSTMPTDVKERICHNAEQGKSLVQLTIKCRFEEFETRMNAKPRKGRVSEGVSSNLCICGYGETCKLTLDAPCKLWIFPNGLEEENRGNIGVFLAGRTGPMLRTLQKDGTFHLYLVDGSDASRINVVGRRIDKFGEEDYFKGEDYVWVWEVSHERVKNALQADGSLVVVAYIEFLVPYDLLLWPAKVSRFYGNAASSDCSIQIGGETIPAHKVFLMACSPVFEAMFTNPLMEESKSGVVKITDFQRPEPMRALVRYCYQGYLDEATKDGDDAVEIFKLADKYLIDDLKAQFEDHFIDERLRKENVIEMAVLADAHSAPKLKKACTMLIAEEWGTISESTEWKKLEEKMPELVAELAEAATAEWKRLEEGMPEKSSSHKYLGKSAIQLKIKQRIDNVRLDSGTRRLVLLVTLATPFQFEALIDTTQPGEGELWSEGVSSELAPNVVWKLKAYPNGKSEDRRGNISVYLYLIQSMKTIEENISVSSRIYLVDGSDGSKIDVLERRIRNFDRQEDHFGGRVSHDQVRKALHGDGSLLVAADVEFLLPAENLQRWATKFLRFYGDAASSDCSIEIGGETIPAHKVFLIASSPVFEAMFTNPSSEESKSGVVKITDFQCPDPMRALVRYCYTGFLDEMMHALVRYCYRGDFEPIDEELAEDDMAPFCKLVDKYCFYDLKAIFEMCFIDDLSKENVIKVAVLSNALSSKKLKDACTKLIAKEWDTVSESTEWKKLKEEMPELAAELASTATAEE